MRVQFTVQPACKDVKSFMTIITSSYVILNYYTLSLFLLPKLYCLKSTNYCCKNIRSSGRGACFHRPLESRRSNSSDNSQNHSQSMPRFGPSRVVFHALINRQPWAFTVITTHTDTTKKKAALSKHLLLSHRFLFIMHMPRFIISSTAEQIDRPAWRHWMGWGEY